MKHDDNIWLTVPGYTEVEENIFAIQETDFELITMSPNVRFEMHFEINRD